MQEPETTITINDQILKIENKTFDKPEVLQSTENNYITKVEDLLIGSTYELSGIAIFGNIVDCTKVELFGTFGKTYIDYRLGEPPTVKKMYRFLILNKLPADVIWRDMEQEEMQYLLDKKLLKIKESE